MITLWLLGFLACFIFWIVVMVGDRRSVLSGFLLVMSVIFLGAWLISFAQADSQWFSDHLFFHILLDAELLILVAILIAYPMVMLPLFLFGGIILVKKEGIKPQNILAIALAFCLFFFEIVYPFIFDVTTPSISTKIYWYMSLIALYFVIHLLSFTLSNVINLIHVKKNKALNYVVVLGAGLKGDKPTPLLRGRIDKGIEVYRNNPGSRIIFSGGQGKDEIVSEASAMAEYAFLNGVKKEDAILEDGSRNTKENLLFSSQLMKEKGKERFALVTSSYHVIRSLSIARRLGLNCIGYGARTKMYFSINAFLREYIGYCRDTRKRRIIHLVALTFLYVCAFLKIKIL